MEQDRCRHRMRTSGFFALLSGIGIALSSLQLPEGAHGMGQIISLVEGSISRCRVESADPKFSPTDSRYLVRGKCDVFHSSNLKKKPGDPPNIESTFANETLDYIISWEAHAKYAPGTKTAEETISVLKRVRPDQDNFTSVGKINVTMQCEQDPWLQPHTQSCSMNYFGKDQALNFYDLNGLYVTNAIYPASSQLTPELRASLNSQQRWYLSLFQNPNQRTPDRARPDKGFQSQSKSRVGAGDPNIQAKFIQTYPTVLSPPAGQRFFAQSVIPIKLAPSPSVTATNYEVVIQRQGANGSWITHHSFPIGPAEAQSPNGYQGFGAGGAGPTKLTPLLTSPGLWRLQARILQPTMLAWSPWVEFMVLPPLTQETVTQPSSQRLGTGPSLIRPRGVEGETPTPQSESSPASR